MICQRCQSWCLCHSDPKFALLWRKCVACGWTTKAIAAVEKEEDDLETL